MTDPDESVASEAASDIDAPAEGLPDEVAEIEPIQAALRQVRREAFKAGLVYALVDAAVVGMLVTLVLTGVDVAAVPKTISIAVPKPVSDVLTTLLGTPEGRVVVSGAAVVGIGVAILNTVAELLYLRRVDPIRWFERANPETAEALRTARDTVADDDDGLMARRLYGDVLDRLRSASGARLLDRRRLLIPIVLLILVSIGATQTAVIGFTIDLPDISTDGSRPPDQPVPGDGQGPIGEDPGGLAPGRDVLGEPTDPPRGEVPDDVVIDPGTGGSDVDRPYETGGFPSGAVDVEAEQAGFAPIEDVEDANLVREYLLRIRQERETSG